MRVDVGFADERIDFEVAEDRLLGAWRGPAGVPTAEVEGRVLEALEHPIEFPPLRQAVVPGDRVVIPFDPEVPEDEHVLAAVCETLRGSGVEVGSILVLATGPGRSGWQEALPAGVASAVHDPDDRGRLAYLASTAQGRRVYLNRHLTDADFVLPVGRLGDDAVLGSRGPWGAIFPGLSDAETLREFRARASDPPRGPDRVRPALAESEDVSWLLGSQFQVGIVAGATGMSRAVAGLAKAVREAGGRAVDEAWTYQAPERRRRGRRRGRPGRPPVGRRRAGAGALGRGEGGPPGGEGRRAVEGRRADRAGPAPTGRRGRPARRARRAAGPGGRGGLPAPHASSPGPSTGPTSTCSARLGEEDVEALSMIALGRPEEARKLVASAASCLFLGHADQTRVEVADGDA